MAIRTYPEIDPNLHEQQFVSKAEAERWAYCRQRFKEFWKQHDRKQRRIPVNYFDKDRAEAGWFFPAKWLRDFELRMIA